MMMSLSISDRGLISGVGVETPLPLSPNQGGSWYGQMARPCAICLHTTNGGWDDSIGWLRSPASGASYHAMIQRESGAIAQLVPFGVPAWGARDDAEFEEQTRWNARLLHLAIDNLGELEQIDGDFRWVKMRRGKPWKHVDEADTIEIEGKRYHRFDEQETGVVLEICAQLYAGGWADRILYHLEIDPAPHFDAFWRSEDGRGLFETLVAERVSQIKGGR
jgi:N-acetyl-anhydromuramyl-L-alanine amidase AmpD